MPTLMKTIYVVAWEYEGGGGFDWYPTEQAADEAFEAERENVEAFKDEGYTAYRFDMDTNAPDASSITDEVELDLIAMCDRAERKIGKRLEEEIA